MIRRANKLRRPDLKAAGRASFRSVPGEHFTLLFAPSPDGVFRASCVVSKKVAAAAVARNALKRRCRAAIFEVVGAAGPPTLLVLRAKQGAPSLSFSSLKEEVRVLCGRAAIL